VILRRSERKPKPITTWEQKGAPSAARDPKITKNSARTEKKTALKPKRGKCRFRDPLIKALLNTPYPQVIKKRLV
jgi:hypothetical protein